MLIAYDHDGTRLIAGSLDESPHAVWIDLLDPTDAEEAAAERLIHANIPTRDEMHEIEVSSRLYSDNGALYMTAIVPENADSDHPVMLPVTFILARDRLITVRYHQPGAFKSFPQRANQANVPCDSAELVLIGILDTVVARLADVLEKASLDIVDNSQDIFHPPARGARRRSVGFQIILRRIGRKEALITNIQESLLTLQRVGSYLDQALHLVPDPGVRKRVKTLARDSRALSEHARTLSQKINFMLDATLGMINIAQSDIIKIVSVAAVVFLPPTLVASIYGMNFAAMPELQWLFGYPFALVLMVISALVPTMVFRRLGWI